MEERAVFCGSKRRRSAVLCMKIITRGTTASREPVHIERPITMLSWALTFIVIALIAGILGFGVLAGTAMYIAKVCFVLFLVLFVISLISGRRGPVA